MIDLNRLQPQQLRSAPYAWAAVEDLFAPADAAGLAAGYPTDHFKDVQGYDGEKGYKYRARSLVHMGAAAATRARHLSPAWRRLAETLLSEQYRAALGRLIGRDLDGALLEVNATVYGPGAWQGPHLDLREKIVTHVLYFNPAWRRDDGGCLRILRAKDPEAAAHEIVPVVGNSAVLVRSDKSWHTVTPVHPACVETRRSLNVIFHQPGSRSSMWSAEEERSATLAGTLRNALGRARRSVRHSVRGTE